MMRLYCQVGMCSFYLFNDLDVKITGSSLLLWRRKQYSIDAVENKESAQTFIYHVENIVELGEGNIDNDGFALRKLWLSRYAHLGLTKKVKVPNDTDTAGSSSLASW